MYNNNFYIRINAVSLEITKYICAHSQTQYALCVYIVKRGIFFSLFSFTLPWHGNMSEGKKK